MRCIALIVLLSIVTPASAITVYTECSKSVVERYGEVIITYTIDNDDVDDIIFPKVDNIRLSGTSNSSYTVFENGKFKSLKKYQFFLMPMEIGVYTIPPATVFYKNKKLSAKPITIKVVESQGGQPSSTPSPSPQPNANRQKFDLNKNLFIRVEPNKQSAYVGEQVVLTYKVYSTIKYENMQMVKAPNYNKCITEELNVDINAEPVIETYNGQRYYANVFKKIALFPTDAGEIIIPPIMMEGTALIPQQVSVISGMNVQMETPKDIKLYTNQVKLSVSNLPTPTPKSFSGGVGKFTLQASIDNAKIGEGEPVTLNMKVSGAGNLKILQAPNLNLEKPLQYYPPNVTEEIDNNGDILQGSKNFEYLIIPENIGKYQLPPVEFSYFDIEKNDYVTYKIPLPGITVERGYNVKNNSIKKSKNTALLTLRDIKSDSRSADWHPMVYFGFGLLGMALASAVYYRRRNMENISAVKVEQQEISKKLSSDKDVFALDEQLIHADNFTFLTTIRKKMISAFQLYTEQMNVSCHLSDYRGVKEEYLSQKFYDLPHTNDIYEHIDRLISLMPEKEILLRYKSHLQDIDNVLYNKNESNFVKNHLFAESLQRLKELQSSLL